MIFSAERFEKFCSQLVIDTKEKGQMPMTWMGTQRYVVQEIERGLAEGVHTFVILKGRQQGISTVTLGLDLYWLFAHKGLQGALVTDDDDNRTLFRSNIINYMEHLPRSLKVPIKTHNRTQLDLVNRSRMVYMVAGKRKNGDLGRGKPVNFLHATECSSWADEEGLGSLYDTLADKNPNRLYLFESPLALDTPVPTPNGWTTMGAIHPGDVVYDESGRETEVVGLSPIFTGRRCFEITFSNGETIVADEGHKWRVERMGSSVSRWSSMDVSTAQLDCERDRIWMGGPLSGREAPLPINPYLLGAWLGDGHSAAVRITCGREDKVAMRNNLVSRGIRVSPDVQCKNGNVVMGVRGMMPSFKLCNLIDNKHIPPIYLRADFESRVELLRGLMDTDGTITKDGHCTFTNGCKALVSDVQELLASLGIRYKTHWVYPGDRLFSNGNTYSCKPYAMIGFKAPSEYVVFALERKAARAKVDRQQRARRSQRVSILSVREVPSVPVRCIGVASESHLFRVGKTMLVTHNTARGYNLFYQMCKTARESSTQRMIFVGWWRNEFYQFPKDSVEYRTYWDGAPTSEERVWIGEVWKKYKFSITDCQLAWWRWHMAEKKHGDETLMLQEHPPTEDYAFQLSGSKFFSNERINQAYQHAITQEAHYFRWKFGLHFEDTEFIETNEDMADVSIWEEPDERGIYVLGCDPAYGSSEWADEFVISVWRCYADKIVQVAEVGVTDWTPVQYAWVMAHLGGFYKGAVVVLEINGPGTTVLNELHNLRRQAGMAMFTAHRQKYDAVGFMRDYFYRRQDSLTAGVALQWQTNAREKIRMLETLRSEFERERIVMNSPGCVEQLRNIRRNGDQIGGEGRAKDDRVIAASLAVCGGWNDTVMLELQAQGRTFQFEHLPRKEGVVKTPLEHNVETFFKRQGISTRFRG